MEITPVFRVEDIFLGTTFDDFTLTPQCSIVEHRENVSLKTKLSKNITLNLPVVSANMRTVTGSTMAIALAQEGGIGILPRGVTVETEAGWVKEVKRAENFIIPSPHTIRHDQTLVEARVLMEKHKVGTLLVTKEGRFVGLLSAKRKMMLCGTKDNRPITELMTPIEKCARTKRPDILSAKDAADELERLDAEKLVWLDENDGVRGLITIKDIANLLHHKWANKDQLGRLIVGAAVGATGDFLERASELINAGADVIVMDTAHAHNAKVVLPAIKEFRKRFEKTEFICGNVATYEGVEFLREFVDGIKVGIGPGAGCQTRNEAGAGVGQLDAVRGTFLASRGIPIIADGGIRKPGDLAKALCMGASSGMLGELLAGTDESPGHVIDHPTKGSIKLYRGETSAQIKLYDAGSSEKIKNIEGHEKEIRYQGSVRKVLHRIRDGLQSMVSYMGEESLAATREKVSKEPWNYFRPASHATQKESQKES